MVADGEGGTTEKHRSRARVDGVDLVLEVKCQRNGEIYGSEALPVLA